MLLSRVAGRIYWAARYMERAEDTSRIVRAHAELVADLPARTQVRWEPLVAIAGSGVRYTQRQIAGPALQQTQTQSRSEPHSPSQSSGPAASGEGRANEEHDVIEFLVGDAQNPGSVSSCVAAARENLRTTRETMPKEAWLTLNDLHLYVSSERERAADRRVRERYLNRVISDSRRLDGVLATAMTHDEAYVMWRLGRALERADMTTRVLGVRAAAVLAMHHDAVIHQLEDHDGVQWMGVLRSLSGLQMYQRSAPGAIEGQSVIQFLLQHDRFPRSVRALLREIRRALAELPDPGAVLDSVDRVDALLYDAVARTSAGADLDAAMDELQSAIAHLDSRITDRYLRVGT